MTIKAAKLQRDFTVEEKSDGSVRVKGKGAGLFGLGFKGLAVMLLLSLMLFSMLAEVSLMAGVLALLAPASFYHLRRSKQFDFTLTKEGVVKGNTAYSDDHIEQFRVFNSGRGAQINQELSYQVGMDFDHKWTPLATQLKEETANQVFDVILKYKSLTKVQLS